MEIERAIKREFRLVTEEEMLAHLLNCYKML